VTFQSVKRLLTQGLIAFTLISIGFALGKHSGHKIGENPSSTAGKENRIIVYYMHATFRCVTCNTIEKMTRALLESSYAPQLANGRILWQEVDFQENIALANKFEVTASCVVVARLKNSEITSFKRLDKVWILMNDPEAFNRYINNAIQKTLDDREVLP